ncbi:MAG: hypothetical protein P8L18_11315 [Verrucomicrobiota bacterium]|nr:hypothetical protein [Verrucomicrobiota bacterium]
MCHGTKYDVERCLVISPYVLVVVQVNPRPSLPNALLVKGAAKSVSKNTLTALGLWKIVHQVLLTVKTGSEVASLRQAGVVQW